MAHLIDKDALVAEIEKRIEALINKKEKLNIKAWNWSIDAEIKDYKSILSFIDTLEVKEVDLEEELNAWRSNHFHGRRDWAAAGEYLERSSQLDIAKYFFELGMSVNNKARKGE